GFPPAEGSRARLRGHRPQPGMLSRDSPSPRVPSSSKGPPRPGGTRADREGAPLVKRRAASCIEIEPDLVAAAIGEADSPAEGRVSAHVANCEPCRVEHAEYRAIDRQVGAMRETPVDVHGVAQSRERLEARLDDLRSRIVAYRVFDSPLGPVLLAHSEQGVVL